MLTPYKVEVFDRDYQFKGFSVIPEPELYFDYLTLEKTDIETKNSITCSKGDFVNVTRGTIVVYQGIVDDIEDTNSGSKLTCKPLISIFDTNIFKEFPVTINDVESFISEIIDENYGNSTDVLQNISGLDVVVLSTTEASFSYDTPVNNFYNVLVDLFSATGVSVWPEFDPQDQTFIIRIGKVQAQTIIESDLPVFFDKEIVLGDSYGSTNKATIINEENTSEQVIYYLSPDGVVSQDGSSRITPVVFTYELVKVNDEETFADVAKASAEKILAPQAYDNQITISFLSDCRIIDSNLPIGTEATIFAKDNAHISILTSYEKTNNTTKLRFGLVRTSLTKKLLIERRKRK